MSEVVNHAALEWDTTGTRKYEVGVKKGVLYPMNEDGTAYQKGVAWNGLTGVTESPSGADLTDLYADDIKYASMRAAETFTATIEAYTYPDEWAKCDGSAEPVAGVLLGQQSRRAFGFCYRTALGSDTITNLETAYKLHIIYNCTASPSERSYSTINDSPDAITFSWEVTGTPVNVGTGYKPTCVITIDSTKVNATKLKALEEKLYGKTGSGTSGNDPTLPAPADVISMLTASDNA